MKQIFIRFDIGRLLYEKVKLAQYELTAEVSILRQIKKFFVKKFFISVLTQIACMFLEVSFMLVDALPVKMLVNALPVV